MLTLFTIAAVAYLVDSVLALILEARAHRRMMRRIPLMVAEAHGQLLREANPERWEEARVYVDAIVRNVERRTA